MPASSCVLERGLALLSRQFYYASITDVVVLSATRGWREREEYAGEADEDHPQ